MHSTHAEEPFAEQFSFVIERLVRTLRAAQAGSEISPSVASALVRLETEGPLRLTQLARTEGVSQPAMTQLAARMEGNGLIDRVVPVGDRRSVLLELTPKGRSAVEHRRARRAAHLESLLDALEPRDRASLRTALPALERLVDAAAPTSPVEPLEAVTPTPRKKRISQ